MQLNGNLIIINYLTVYSKYCLNDSLVILDPTKVSQNIISEVSVTIKILDICFLFSHMLSQNSQRVDSLIL